MTRLQLIDPDTGEVFWQWGKPKGDRIKAARQAHRKALWAWEAKQRGAVPSRRAKGQQRRSSLVEAGTVVVVLGGLALLSIFWK